MSKKILLLRTVRKEDGYSSGDFYWPLKVGAKTRCPDPDPDPSRDCGGGLHGLPWGEGDGSLLDWNDKYFVGLVFEADESEVVFSKGKARAWGEVTVRFVGPIEQCARYIYEHGGAGRAIVGLSPHVHGKGGSVAVSGYRSAATSSGNHSTAISRGDYSFATGSGYYSAAISHGYYSAATSSGDHSTAVSRGDCSIATSSGYISAATSHGTCSTAVANGDCSQAAAIGRATMAIAAGLEGRAAAGEDGVIAIPYVGPGPDHRLRLAVGYVGEDGIKPNTWYRVDGDTGRLIEVGPVEVPSEGKEANDAQR